MRMSDNVLNIFFHRVGKFVFFRELNSFLKNVFSEKCFSQSLQITSLIQLFIQRKHSFRAFQAFRRPEGISQSRNSSPLSKSVAPFRLNLVTPKPDCPPYQQTEHIPSISDVILVQLQVFSCVLITCFFRCV